MPGRVIQHWKTAFRTMRPIPGFVRLRMVGSQTASDTSYRVEGRFRQAEDQCTFQYTLAGEGVFQDATGRHRVPPETGFLCQISDPDISYYYPPGATEHWRFLWISFYGGNAVELTRNLIAHHGPVFRLPADSEIVRRFLAFADSGEEREISAARSVEPVTRLLAALAEAAAQSRGDTAATGLVRRVSELVRTRLHENINVTRLAGALGVSRGYLSRTFTATVGSTLHDYIIRRKVLRACELLKDTSLGHAEIAARLGLGSGAHFSRVFRGVMKMTPRQFRTDGTMPDL